MTDDITNPSQPEPEVVGPSTPFQSLLPLGIPSSPPELAPDELLAMWRALLGSQDVILTEPILALVQAAIATDRARFGRPAPAPAGEVADSVAVLEREAEAAEEGNQWMAPSELRQAATLLRQQQVQIALLERQAAPVPVAITDTQLDAMFRAWWAQSYPTPPGPHALMTHTAWARHLLEQAGVQQQQPEQSR